MSKVLEVLRKGRREIVAPSGVTYTIRSHVGHLEYAATLGGLPTFKKKDTEEAAGNGDLEESFRIQRAICALYVCAMRVGEVEDVGGDIPPPEEWDVRDILPIWNAIQASQAIEGEQADAARRAL